MDLSVFYISVFSTICGLIGSAVCGARGRDPMAGFVLGLLLGPLGIAFALLLSRDRETE